MSSTTRESRLGFLVLLTVSALPAMAGLVYAFLYSVGAVGLLSRGITLRPWIRVLTGVEFWNSLRLSVTVASAVVMVSTAIGLLLALTLRKRIEGALGTFLHVPLTVPGVVGAFLTFQLLSGAGLTARVAVRLGILPETGRFPGLVQDPHGIGIAVAHLSAGFAFLTLFFVALARSERISDLVELASTLGAGPRQSLVRVVLPVLLRQALPSLILLFIAILGSYEIPLLLGVQSPQMLSVLVMRKNGLYDLGEKPEAYCVAILYSVLVLLLLARVIPLEGRRETD